MRVAIVGAGPAGLYAAYLLKRRDVAAEVRIVEQNPPDATFGFGVVFSDRALEFLSADDPETHAAISAELETWDDITLNHGGETIRIDGVGFAAIERLRLLKLLQERVRSVGLEPEFHRRLDSLDEIGGYDLIIGADGVNSLVRSSADFGYSSENLGNRFAWFGTTQRFNTLTQTFKATPDGHFNAHHYRYAAGMSTFIAEVDEATFFGAGFDRMGESETKAKLEEVFADELAGHLLISNRSVWRQFPKIRNARWSVGNRVLVGDALHTAHFSIGSGTRLALEDVIALVKALEAAPRDIPAALAAYEAARRPIVEKLVAAAERSAAWYEDFASHMKLPPWDFAMSYITRSGRVDPGRLRALAPDFMRDWEAQAQGSEAAQ